MRDLAALHIYESPHTLAGTPSGPLSFKATVALLVPGGRVLAGPDGEALLRDDDFDALNQGEFREEGPPQGSDVVVFGCAVPEPDGRGVHIEACPHFPSAIRTEPRRFLRALREDAVRALVALAAAAGLAGLWLTSTWLALVRRRYGPEHVAEDSFEIRLGLPIWVRPPSAGEELL